MVKIDAPLHTVQEALEKHLASIKRAINTVKTPDVKACYEKQLTQAAHALNTLQEIK